MNYKVICFKCGCKYKWFNGTERPYKVCPEHKRPVGSYIIWCEMCGKKVVAIPRAGYRQKRCSDCKVIHERKESKMWFARHPGYQRGRDTNKYRKEKPQETPQEEAKRIINEIFENLGLKYVPVRGGV